MLTVLAIVVIAVVFAFILLQSFTIARAKRMAGQQVPEHIFKRLKLPKQSPALIYFTSPSCSMCRIQEQEMNNWKPAHAKFVKVNIAEKLDVAKYFNIMGTPSFVLVDASGMISQILIGRQPLSKLDRIIEEAAARKNGS